MSRTDPDRKTERLNLRLSPRQRDLIDEAARAVGKDVSSFVLDAATEVAVEIDRDRLRIELDESAWDAFQEALAGGPAPLGSMPRLERLLADTTDD